MPGQTIDTLFDERRPLYGKYADFTVSTAGVTPDQAVTAVLRQLKS
jgi:shikimate kinase